MLTAFVALSAVDPLRCFVAEPGAKSGANVCPHTYALHEGNDVKACANLCLTDPACQAFAMGSAGDPTSTDCRLSHDCAEPEVHLSGYDGYTRKKSGDCTGPHQGIAFHGRNGLFSDGMILQRGGSTAVWGEGAKARSTVTVSVGGVQMAAKTTADANGYWMATLPPVGATSSTTLSVTDGLTNATLQDVAFGDVMVMCNPKFRLLPPPPSHDAAKSCLEDLKPWAHKSLYRHHTHSSAVANPTWALACVAHNPRTRRQPRP